MSSTMLAARGPMLAATSGTLMPQLGMAAVRLSHAPLATYATGLRATPSLATSSVHTRQLSFNHRPQIKAAPLQLSKPLALSPQVSKANFSFTSRSPFKEKYEAFPEPEHPGRIKKTKGMWEHPGYTEEQMTSVVQFEHREPKDMSDRFALFLMRMLRKGTDFLTGYSHDVEDAVTAADPKAMQKTKPYKMSERKWLIRFIFLESVAAVPGMVGGMLRHLHSLRRMKRDNGWIESLLEEAYNERMHLLTFLKMAEPGWFMRFMCLGAQGVFFNSMFLSYLISPRTAHRFVGYLEEEAVLTYSLVLKDIEAGKLPKWEKLQAPDIAIEYWKMPEGHRTMRDLILYIRADEAKHREVNHTLGNLLQKVDPNPFNSEYKDDKPHPSKGLEHHHGKGWERQEVI